MRRLLATLVAAGLLAGGAAGCGEGNSSDDQADLAPPQSAANPDPDAGAGSDDQLQDLVLTSSAFADGGTIPSAQVCEDQGGQNLSPELVWNGLPAATDTLALVVDDPDAPIEGGFVHWVVVDLDPASGGLGEGQELGSPGANGLGQAGWFGPCPPPGDPHTYVFTLYVFGEPQDWPEMPTRDDVVDRAATEAISTAVLTGTFGNAG